MHSGRNTVDGAATPSSSPTRCEDCLESKQPNNEHGENYYWSDRLHYGGDIPGLATAIYYLCATRNA
jgi:hypothetical protein